MLQKVHARNTLETAVAAIGDYIIRNELRAGDRLPGEIELSEALGISRTILREALRHYRTLGLISSRPRIGMVVEKLLPDDPYQGYLPFIAANRAALREIAELRICLEAGAAELICARVSGRDLSVLRGIAGKMRIAVPEEIDPLDIEFHSYLLRITGNHMIASLIPLLVEFFRLQSPYSVPEMSKPEQRTRNADLHFRLVDSLEARNAGLFRRLIARHIIPEARKFTQAGK